MNYLQTALTAKLLHPTDPAAQRVVIDIIFNNTVPSEACKNEAVLLQTAKKYVQTAKEGFAAMLNYKGSSEANELVPYLAKHFFKSKAQLRMKQAIIEFYSSESTASLYALEKKHELPNSTLFRGSAFMDELIKTCSLINEDVNSVGNKQAAKDLTKIIQDDIAKLEALKANLASPEAKAKGYES